MLPYRTIDLTADVTLITQPTKTYMMNFEQKRIVGFCTGLEAVRQAIYKILNSERFEYIIYSWNYGTELRNIFGNSRSYAQAELKKNITEALLQDDRIMTVSDFSFELGRESITVTFTVNTTYGNVVMDKEVKG